MKKYPKYKPSGVEWIGEIPEEWGIKKLKYVVKLRDELIIDSEFIIAVENIESGTGKLVNIEGDIKFQGQLSAFRHSDIIFNKLRPYLHKVYFAEKDGALFGELLIIHSLGELIPKFLFYILFSKAFIDIVDGSTQGTKMPRANWNNFISLLPVSFPLDIDEQTAIANYLDDKTTKIDTLIEKKKKLIELLKEERTAVINHYVLGQHLLIDNGELTMDNSQFSIMNCKLPKHWVVKKLKYIVNGIYDTEHKTVPFVDNGDYYVARTSDIREGKLNIESMRRTDETGFNEWTKRAIPEEGDIIFTREAPAGEACIIPNNIKVCLGQRTVLFKIDPHKANSGFILSSIYSITVREFVNILSQGSTVTHFNMADIRNIVFLLPSLEEQNRINNHIETETKRIDCTITKIEKEIELLEEYRTALISEVVTGKIKIIDNG